MHVEDRQPLERVELTAVGTKLVASAVSDPYQPGSVGAIQGEVTQHAVPLRERTHRQCGGCSREGNQAYLTGAGMSIITESFAPFQRSLVER